MREIFLEIFHERVEIDLMSTAVKERPFSRVKINLAREGNRLAQLRADLGWTRNQLARVMNASERAIVNWESGDPISAVYAAKMREIDSLYTELKQLMKPKEIGLWLWTEMDEFEKRSPADLISRGETGRVWASLFYLRSGMPD
jgi:transcriptional regulator with XRE-family HTH domain